MSSRDFICILSICLTTGLFEIQADDLNAALWLEKRPLVDKRAAKERAHRPLAGTIEPRRSGETNSTIIRYHAAVSQQAAREDWRSFSSISGERCVDMKSQIFLRAYRPRGKMPDPARDSIFRSSSNISERCQPFDRCALHKRPHRQRSSYASINKTALVHLLGVIDVPKVDNNRTSHQIAQAI